MKIGELVEEARDTITVRRASRCPAGDVSRVSTGLIAVVVAPLATRVRVAEARVKADRG